MRMEAEVREMQQKPRNSKDCQINQQSRRDDGDGFSFTASKGTTRADTLTLDFSL